MHRSYIVLASTTTGAGWQQVMCNHSATVTATHTLVVYTFYQHGTTSTFQEIIRIQEGLGYCEQHHQECVHYITGTAKTIVLEDEFVVLHPAQSVSKEKDIVEKKAATATAGLPRESRAEGIQSLVVVVLVLPELPSHLSPITGHDASLTTP